MSTQSKARTRRATFPLKAALLISSALFAPAARAQDSAAPPASAEPATTEFDAGIDASVGYSDNIFATRQGEVDDVLLTVRPSLNFNLRSGDDRLTLRAEGEIGRYADFSSENYDDWLIGLDGRLRAAPRLTLLAGGEYQWKHESRASPDAVNGVEPTRYERGYGFAAAQYRGGGWSARLAGAVTSLDFRDVAATAGAINNDDRDRIQSEFGARVGFNVAPRLELFAQGSYDRRDYDEAADDFGFRRDSVGFGLVAGVRKTLADRLTAELSAGYLAQSYRDPRLPDVRGVDFGALVEWTGPAGLTATFRLDRSVEETTLPGAPSYLLTAGTLGLRAEPHARIQAGMALTGAHYDFRGAPRTEFVTGAELWARYWLGRHVYLGIDYRFAQRASDSAGFDYDENRLFLRLGAQLRPRWRGDAAPLLLSQEAPGGPYLGLLLGHGTLVTGLDGPRGPGSNTADFGGRGLAYGAVAGWGFVSGRLYAGAELEAFAGGADWLHVASRTFSVDRKDSFGIAARLGFLTGARDLVYGRFGIGSASFRTDYLHSASAFGESERRTGTGFGLGLEARAGRSAFVRAEYVVTSYGDYDVPTGAGESGIPQFDNFSNSEGQFRIGAGLRFGTPSQGAREAAATDFSGPYVGVQIGHGALGSRNLGERTGDVPVDIMRSAHGPMAGVMAGWGTSLRRFYVGAETEADVSGIDWNIERDPTGRIYSARHEYSFGGAARAGWRLSSSALLYARAGVVRTRFDIPYETTNRTVRSRETLTGLRFGGGLEIGLGGRARLRLDYTVTDYRRYDVFYGENSDSFDHTESLLRAGLLWRL
jgi:hypothetical protein